jgi:hypothetical protein
MNSRWCNLIALATERTQVDELELGSGRRTAVAETRRKLGLPQTNPEGVQVRASLSHAFPPAPTSFEPKILQYLAFSRSRSSATGILMGRQGINSKYLRGLFTDFRLHLSFDRCASWISFGTFLPAKETSWHPRRNRWRAPERFKRRGIVFRDLVNALPLVRGMSLLDQQSARVRMRSRQTSTLTRTFWRSA